MVHYNYEKCITVWNKQWNSICNALENNISILPKFETLVSDDIFSQVVAQVLEYSDLFTVYPSDIGSIFRGIREADPSMVCPERFIPKIEFINPNQPSRMNGIDRLYNYFSIDYCGCRGENLIYTSAHELRLQKDDVFWGCSFIFLPEFKTMKIIDLSTKGVIPTSDEKFDRFLKLKAIRWKPRPRVDQQAIQYWFLQSMFNVWEHSEMFAPVDKAKPETLWHQYRPFHVLCDFFQRNGFGGIIYRSTVYQKGICLALFDISTAICDERTITQYDAAKYC